MLKKIQLFLLLFLIINIISVKGLYAIDVFSDNFNERDEYKWKYENNGGDISFNNGVMNLVSSELHFPFIVNSEAKKLSEYDNATLEFRYSYGELGYMGNGFGIGYTGNNDYPYYQFSIWNAIGFGLVFQYRNVQMLPDGSCDYSNEPLLKKSLLGEFDNNYWHTFKIEKTNNKYNIFLDSEKIFTTDDNQCISQNLFLGNSQTGGRKDWNVLNIDYVKLYTNFSTKNKIIILPGLGASWNPEAILLGDTSPSYQWTMTPFVNNYNLLINGLNSNGLILNQDYYVWNYDWRKPLSQIIFDFNNYVNGLNLESGQKLDLVGHSLGGLVARIWTQDHLEMIDKTISLGSPHYGSVKAYETWNGVKISDNVDMASIGLNVLLQLQKNKFDTSVQTLRNYAPVVFDLIPTFDFLKKNGQVITTRYSQYLAGKNNDLISSVEKMLTIDGIGVTTKEWINLGQRTFFDKTLGLWEDGTPLSYNYAEGDGTVLKKSAVILGSEVFEYDSDHRSLVDKSTNYILGKLGLGITVSGDILYSSNQIIFYLGSPAKMTVNCDGIEKDDVAGWVIMENQNVDNCKVKLVGKDGGGVYHLVIGDNNKWRYFEGEIMNNQTILFLENKIKDSWEILKNDFQKLGADKAFKAAKKENILETVEAYVLFRQKTCNFKYSEEILDNLIIIINNKKNTSIAYKYMVNFRKQMFTLVQNKMISLGSKKINSSYADSLNYFQAINLIKSGSDYGENYLATRLLILMSTNCGGR